MARNLKLAFAALVSMATVAQAGTDIVNPRLVPVNVVPLFKLIGENNPKAAAALEGVEPGTAKSDTAVKSILDNVSTTLLNRELPPLTRAQRQDASALLGKTIDAMGSPTPAMLRLKAQLAKP